MEAELEHTDTTGGKSDATPSSAVHWYVAIVGNNTEKACGDKLEKAGYEIYVPTQREMRRWRNGRRKLIDRVVIPSVVFIRCTEQERKKEIVALPYIKRFMTDRARQGSTPSGRTIAVVPDEQIEKLRFILYNSDSPVSIESAPLRLGDKVRVVRGRLMGIVGNVIQHREGNPDIIVQLDILGCARMNISEDDLERI